MHKQAVSGDAPSAFSTTASSAERAKYQAWRAKSGLAKPEAMGLYLQESDRQIRVYGTASQPTRSASTSNINGTSSSRQNDEMASAPRGLAAVPLLCAAAAESRKAYLRRLSQTPVEAAWWGRQEALCGESPTSLSAWPEVLVIFLAKHVEWWSLTASNKIVAALLWPLHNSFLSLWILAIALLTIGGAAWQILQILIWGARRTGISLGLVWKDLSLLVSTVHTVCEPHQALTCRLVGLSLLPASYTIAILEKAIPSMTLASAALVILLGTTWWYFCLVLPWLFSLMLGVATVSGFCFAVIEVAGV